ncbi:sporulation protein [Shimazuella sp. AN120528]|uniref:sporulation protein n=1 Tax=Shimazuella soli TaxID=1892854 RepID=UPI001F0E51C1|nr:sporulation protein [Shimazuella soli]MCH5586562.1 sporulation protein [Shimazuella soli]
MNLFRKSLTTFGVGSAKVDTRLEKSTYMQGEIVKGKVYVLGGQAEQFVDEIYLFLNIQYELDGSQSEYMVEKVLITEPFTIGPKEERQFEFEFQLPYDCPVSISGAPIFLRTGLDIKLARDPQDIDGIEVLPHPYIDMILEAIEANNFRLSKVTFDFEHHFSRHPFVQMYCCEPVSGVEFDLDSASFVFFAHQNEVEVIMHLDKKGDDIFSSMEEALKLDERLGRFTILLNDIHQGKQHLINRVKTEMEKALQ